MNVARCLPMLGASLLVLSGGAALFAQQKGPANGKGGKSANEAALPNDPKLLVLHKEFVTKAEKLAMEYEKAHQNDKARAVYHEILKLVPKYPKAVEALDKLDEKELTASKKTLDIWANKKPQDTGVVVIPGKRIRISVAGEWKLGLSYTLGPKGIEMPKEAKEFNLGSLVGFVETGGKDRKPFLVGEGYEFVPEEAGTLYLGMWDVNWDDNSGKLSVTIQGTFEKGK